MASIFRSGAMGKVLKKCRENCGLSQQQVAAALGIDRSTYTYYELGNTTPSAPVIIRLSRILNVPYSVFMDAFKKEELALSDNIDSDDFKQASEPKQNISVEPIYSLSKDEQAILCYYRAFSNEQKDQLMKLAGEMAVKNMRDDKDASRNRN